MMDRRSFFGVAAAAMAFGRKAAGYSPAASPVSVAAPAVEDSRRLRVEEEIDRHIEDVALLPFPAFPSGWDRDVLIVDHIQVRCCVSNELIADSDIGVCEEVENRIARALFERIEAAWVAAAGSDEVADVYPIRKWDDEERGIVEFRRGALRLKPDQTKPHPYQPPQGHVVYPLTKSFRFFDS